MRLRMALMVALFLAGSVVGQSSLGINCESADRKPAVLGVEDGSSAEPAGIQRWDVITRIGTTAVTTLSDLQGKLAEVAPGTKVAVTIDRDGTTLTKEVTTVAPNIPAVPSGAAKEALAEIKDVRGEAITVRHLPWETVVGVRLRSRD